MPGKNSPFRYFRHFIAAVIALTAMPALSECRVLDCANCAFPAGTWDIAERIQFSGGELPTVLGTHDGDILRYSGPATNDFVSFGPYYDQDASKVRVTALFNISTKWTPATHKTCHTRDWQNGCVGWTDHNDESGFVVDYTIGNGPGNQRTVIHSKTFKNINAVNHETIAMPPLECNQNIQGLEVRIRGLYSGDVEFTVHSLELELRYNTSQYE